MSREAGAIQFDIISFDSALAYSTLAIEYKKTILYLIDSPLSSSIRFNVQSKFLVATSLFAMSVPGVVTLLLKMNDPNKAGLGKFRGEPCFFARD
ncbi:hypothetical protein [Chromobacterium haemolyticum]|uniref:hypothetical protein n=1 Tax=Chromobacterium haemolyticum TaxID=394935 RepID=UPI001130C7A5|nr:hypothetical protein [Chromobacterium haemolyticum]